MTTVQMLEFRLFGSTELLTQDGRPVHVVLGQPKRIALLTYLALAWPRGFHRRDRLLPLFWPEADESRARHALNQALYVLRHALGESAVLSRNDEEVGLDWEQWRCDVVSFRTSLAAGRLEEALAGYRGELASGFHADAAPEFDQWLDDQRRSAQRAAYEAALELSARAEAAADRNGAEHWLRRALEIAPYEERAVSRLLALRVEGGDGAGAVAAYEAFAARLAAELEATPSRELRALAERARSLQHSLVPGPPPGGGARSPATPRPSMRRHLLPGAAALLALLAIATLAFLARGPAEPAERAELVVAAFVNRTADAELGTIVTEWLRADLVQSPAIRLVGTGELREILELMRHSPQTPLDAVTAREVAVRGSFELVLEGTIGSAGTGYVLTATLLGTEAGETLATFRESARRGEELVDAIGSLSARIRRQLGESVSGIGKTPPLHKVTTHSLEALRRYTAAWRVINPCEPGCRERFVALLEEAVAIDTAFGAAYRSLGNHFYQRGDRDRALPYLAKAYRFRERMTEIERQHTIGTYHRLVTGDRVRAINAFSAALELARGDDDMAFGALEHLGLLYYAERDYARAEVMWQRRAEVRCGPLRCGPQPAYTFEYWAEALAAQGKLQQAMIVLQRADSLWPAEGMRALVAEVAYAMHGVHGVDSALRAGDHRGRFGTRPVDSVLVGSLFPPRRATIEGRLEDAERLYHRAGLGWPTLPQLLSETDIFVRQDPAASRRRLERAFPPHVFDSLPPLERPYPSFILSLSRGGHVREARTLLEEFQREVPDSVRHLALNARWIDYARGELAMAEGTPMEAVRHFRNGLRTVSCVACVLPALGRAFEAAGQPDSAIAAYEQYLGSPSDLARSYFDGTYLAFLFERLAELYERRGEHRRAAAYCARLVHLWRRADAELQPRVERARARLAALAG